MAETWTIEIEQENKMINGEIMPTTLPYTLPVATDTVLGGVMPEKKSEAMNKVVGVDEQGRLWTENSEQDLTGYATEDYVNQAIEKIELMPGPTGPKGNDGAPGPQGEQGEKGEPGVSGVYVGSGEIPEGYNIQIDPSGEAPVLVQATPQELTEEQQIQVRKNIGAVEAPETAEVGQTIVVKTVDENGKPTAWEAVDLPSGGSDTEVYYVDIEDNGDGTYSPNRTTNEVGAAYFSGLDIKARIELGGMMLIVPLCAHQGDTVIYGGATNNQTVSIVHTSTRATVLMEELTLQSSFNELNQWVEDIDNNIGSCIPYADTAKVGQVPVVKNVLNGMPNGWEMVDLPSGGGDTLEFIKTVKLTEEVSTIKINTDDNGNPLNLKRIVVAAKTIGGTNNANKSNYWYHPGSVNAGAIRGTVSQGVYATNAAVISIVDVQMITKGSYLLYDACNNTNVHQSWGSYNNEPAIKELNLGISTTDYTFGVNTIFYVMGVRA